MPPPEPLTEKGTRITMRIRPLWGLGLVEQTVLTYELVRWGGSEWVLEKRLPSYTLPRTPQSIPYERTFYTFKPGTVIVMHDDGETYRRIASESQPDENQTFH